MGSRGYGGWMAAGFEFWTLGVEASEVIGLRIARLMAGDRSAGVEAQLMVTEKVRAMVELQAKMMTGAIGSSALSTTQGTLRHYPRKVAANRRRLLQSKR